MSEATWTKLRDGSWGIRVAGTPPAPGATITVRRRDGGSAPAVVGAILWQGGDVALCSVARSLAAPLSRPDPGRAATHYRSRSGGYGWVCPACGEENSYQDASCWECGCGRRRQGVRS